MESLQRVPLHMATSIIMDNSYKQLKHMGTNSHDTNWFNKSAQEGTNEPYKLPQGDSDA